MKWISYQGMDGLLTKSDALQVGVGGDYKRVGGGGLITKPTSKRECLLERGALRNTFATTFSRKIAARILQLIQIKLSNGSLQL